MKSTLDTLARALLLFGAFGFAAEVRAQEPEKKEEEEKKDEPEAADEKPKEDVKDEWFVVVNADVYTGTGSVIRDAGILAKNGVIREIGSEFDIPEGATVLDAGGGRVYPGLVAYSSSGLVGSAGSDFQDTVDPFNSRMVLALGNGITSTGQGGAALKLKRREIKGVVMREKYVLPLSYSFTNPSGRRSLLEKLESTSKYLRAYREWEEKKKEDKDLKEPPKKDVDSQILQILKGEALGRFNADSRDDLLAIAKLAQRFSFRPVIEGCNEGWTVAEELGRAGAYAIITPRDRRDKSEELVADGGTSIENAAILHAHGVQVAIVPAQRSVDLGGIAGRDILHLPIEAGFAVRGGLPEQAAFEAITLVPARALGVDHRVGTLEVGKDCDLIVTDGDILHYETFVQQAVVEGKVVYEKNKELYYAHIRPRPESILAPEKRVDKGQEPPEEKTTPEDGEKKDDKDSERGGEKKGD